MSEAAIPGAVTPETIWVSAGEVRLRVLALGPADAEPVILLHGMRDVAWSLLPVALPLAERHRVLLPELRGHGESDRPGVYTLDHYLFDLHRVMSELQIDRAAVFGHSLGGQILARFSAVFPDRVRLAIIAEGLGPPDRPGDRDPALDIAGHGAHLLEVLSVSRHQRPLPHLEFAAERLRRNNPRLSAAAARALAQQATRRIDGALYWAFDPRVRSTFLSVRRADTERYWRQVRCPTLIVTGDLAHEYWHQQIPGLPGWDGRFAPGELEERLACFADHEHVVIPGAGHMLHYDRPEALTAAITNFLERRL